MKDFKLKFFIAVSILCLAASCGGDDDPEASEPAVTLHLTDKGYFDGLLYYKITSNSTNEVEIIGAESTAVTAVIPSYVIIDGKTFTCTTIEYKAFYEHTKLTTIVIPKTIKEIGKSAFCGCWHLASVTIGNGVMTIGDYAFESCIALTSITLPNSLTSIGWNAFSYCTALTSITIPNSVTSIGKYAFEYCGNLKTVKSEIENPFEINAFGYNSMSSSTLIVPKGTKNLYQATNGWNVFGNIIEE